jgi:sulfoacetaldehyde acetyltransferase
MVVFRNYQWGAEKRNSTLWYDDNFVGTELDNRSAMPASRAPAACRACQARTMEDLREALPRDRPTRWSMARPR